MCGDIEDEGTRYEGDLYQRFLVHSRAVARAPAQGDDLNAYLDRLFADLLKRCVADSQAGEAADGYRRMAMQSLVLGRLAGFLAGHVALNEDPMRKLMEATMLGYAEADAPPASHDHGHDHGHDHDHGHGHHENH
jgi:hypothetical protein